MRHLLILTFILLLGINGQSQTAKPIKWQISLSTKDAKIGDEIEIIMKAEINKNWYLYSSDFDPDLGPTTTTINFEGSEGIKVESAIRPIGAKEKYDSLWEGKVRYFVGTGEFRQKIKIVNSNPIIKALIDYQVCSDKEGKCIPYEEKIFFDNLKVEASEATKVEPMKTEEKVDVDTRAIVKDKKKNEETVVQAQKEVSLKSDLLSLEKEKEKLIVKDKKGNDKAVEQLKDFTKKYGGK